MEVNKVMDKLLKLIDDAYIVFKEQAEKGKKGNASAARKARVKSSEMTKLFKEYRAISK